MHADDFLGSGAMFDFTLGYPQTDLSFASLESVPLSQNALFHHTSKLGATLTPPSPIFRDSSLSPVPSSITSASSDDATSDYFVIPSDLAVSEPPAKRPRTQSPPATPPRLPIKSIRPALPRPIQAQRPLASAPARLSTLQPRRYRAILPAPPRSESQPLGRNPQRPGVHASHSGKQSQSVKSKPDGVTFQHMPTNLPPVRYPKGQDSPFRPEAIQGTIPGSMLDTLPLLEARFDRLEAAILKYTQYRHDLALQNSLIDGLKPDY